MKKKLPLMALFVSMTSMSVHFSNADVTARWDTNSSHSTGPSAEDWDGKSFNNVGGFDNYSITAGTSGVTPDVNADLYPDSDNDGIRDPGNNPYQTALFGNQFSYIQGTGSAPGPKGRWEDAVGTVNDPYRPSGNRMVVQPLTPNSATAHDFYDDTKGGSEGHQINLGRNTTLDSLVNDFYVETNFTAGSLRDGSTADWDYNAIMAYDHSAGGSSENNAINEGWKMGVAENKVHFTTYGIVDAFWNTTLVAGTNYTVRFELNDAGGGQTDIEAFLDGTSLGVQTYDNIIQVTTLDTEGDAQHDTDHLNDWYIGSGGTGQYFDGTINYVEVGVVPEPSSFFLLGIGSLSLLYRRRR